MTNISNQAKDDVRGLLYDIVVKPVSEEAKEQQNTIIQCLEDLKKQAGGINAIKGLISTRLQSQDFIEKYNELSNNITFILTKCKSISQITNTLNTLDTQANESHKGITELGQQSREQADGINTIKELISTRLQSQDFIEKYNELIRNITTILSKCENISQITNALNTLDSQNNEKHKEIKELHTLWVQQLAGEILMLKNSVEANNEEYAKLCNQIQITNTQIAKIEKEISHQKEKETEIETKANSLIKGHDCIINQLKDNKSEINKALDRIYKKNNKSLVIITILTILNLIGMSAFLLMNYIK